LDEDNKMYRKGENVMRNLTLEVGGEFSVVSAVGITDHDDPIGVTGGGQLAQKARVAPTD
jgi:hypothetical protein